MTDAQRRVAQIEWRCTILSAVLHHLIRRLGAVQAELDALSEEREFLLHEQRHAQVLHSLRLSHSTHSTSPILGTVITDTEERS
jgi:hypothetical protein